jgi:tol-pal system protein YbgF
MNELKILTFFSVVWLAILTQPLCAASLEERVAQLERLLNSQKVLDREQQFVRIQQDLQTLRGELEMLNHQVKLMEKQQQDMYLDIIGQLRPDSAPSLSEKAEVSVEIPESATETASESAVTAIEENEVKIGDDKAAYQRAFGFLQQGQYEQAITAFKTQLDQYPQGKQAEDAHYWLAETYYALKQYDAALNAFGRFLEKYSKSPKYAHAQLKIGYIYYELADYIAARSLLEQVKENHPDTATAHLAEERLQLMRKEGL